LSGGEQRGDGRDREYGAAALPRGVKHLARTFTWFLPAAVSAHPAWASLPLGDAGTIEVTLVVGADGALEHADYDLNAPEHLRAIVERTMLLLRAGKYAIAARAGVAGKERLRISVTLSQREPSEAAGRKPGDALAFGRDWPTLALPGRAYFTLVSGRHFEAQIAIVWSTASEEAQRTQDDTVDPDDAE
jgi:hypothetical protein